MRGSNSSTVTGGLPIVHTSHGQNSSEPPEAGASRTSLTCEDVGDPNIALKSLRKLVGDDFRVFEWKAEDVCQEDYSTGAGGSRLGSGRGRVEVCSVHYGALRLAWEDVTLCAMFACSHLCVKKYRCICGCLRPLVLVEEREAVRWRVHGSTGMSCGILSK